MHRGPGQTAEMASLEETARANRIFLHILVHRRARVRSPGSERSPASLAKQAAMNERPSYVERTWAPAWVLVLLWISCLVGAGALIWGWQAEAGAATGLGTDPAPTWLMVSSAGLLTGIPLFISVAASRLEVEVWADALRVAFGPLRILRKVIPYEEIQAPEAVTYRPIRDFGGWGVRFRPGRTAWTVRGNRAVRLTLSGGKQFFIGSRFPHRLAERIEVAQRLKRSKASR